MKASEKLVCVGVLGFLLFASCVALAQAPGKTLPERMSVDLGDGMKMDFVLIKPGSFKMGSEKGFKWDQAPAHQVTLSKPFYMGIHEVTQAQWKALMGNSPSSFQGDDLPVEQVSWEDCQKFLAKLTGKVGQGLTCRLPTEAEWEYACRAGSQGEYCFGDDERSLGEYAWYFANSEGKTHPVGQKKPNAWGLYDMHGNVWEWCADWYGDCYSPSAATDPKGPASGMARVLRGGSWYCYPELCRSADRFRLKPAHRTTLSGLRVVAAQE